jgi:hypothetical protein
VFARFGVNLGAFLKALRPLPELGCLVHAGKTSNSQPPFRAGTTLHQKSYSVAVSTFMSSQIGKHFEEYARHCSELAHAAATPESRQRLLKMAGEYMHAAELMRRRTSESPESNPPRPPRVISANLDPRMPSRSARAPQSIDHPAPSRTAARFASHSPASTSSFCALSVRIEHTDR